MPKASARTLVLRPADPFDLIRWLARSQSDPRKAVAELVQNSIDAHARHVVVSRRRLRGGPALTVRDDGEGVLPGLGAKDLSQHAHRVPGAVEASEDVAAILALAERNLRGA